MAAKGEYIATIKHEGHDIGVTRDGRFVVTIDDEPHWYAKCDDAKARIDDLRKREARRERIDVEVLTIDGMPHKLTGYHAGHGHALLTPKPKHRISRGEIFVANRETKRLIKRHNALYQEIHDIEKQLKEFRVPEGTGYTVTLETLASTTARALEAWEQFRDE